MPEITSIALRTDRLIPVLRVAVIAFIAVYVVLVVTTVYFATWQTQEVSSVRDTEAAIGTLETKYYDSVAKANETDPATFGFVKPTDVKYVTATRETGLSYAGR
jgi:hypothetical protein